ncbi:hypothetical protein Tco_0646754 [Tanacetum coccineum]
MLCVSYLPLQIALVHLLAARDHKLRTLSVEMSQLQFESRVARSLLTEKETEIQGMRDTQSQHGADVFILASSLISKANYVNSPKKWIPKLKHFAPSIPIVIVGTMVSYSGKACYNLTDLISHIQQKTSSEDEKYMANRDCGVAPVVFNLARGYFGFKLDERLKVLRTGKTTSILALANELLGPNYKEAFLELNASYDRGIDVVRN